MDEILKYMTVFSIGGIICVIGQILLNTTKLTPARILVIFLLSGVILETLGLFEPIKEFAQNGITIPICGFGSVLARGAMEGANEYGLLGAFTGAVEVAAAGLSAAIIIGFVMSIIFKSKDRGL